MARIVRHGHATCSRIGVSNMADFTAVRARLDSEGKAAALLPNLHTIYNQSKFAKEVIELYTSGADPAFNQAMNSIFSTAERQEIQQMLNQLNNLVNDWTTNHYALITQPI